MIAKELLEGSGMGGSFQNGYPAGVKVPGFKGGIERKYQVMIKDSEVNNLWLETRLFLGFYATLPVQAVNSVGRVHSDNQDHDRCRPAPEKPYCQREKSRCGAILEV